MLHKVAWPSGLRRWFKAPVSSEAWVRIPPLPTISFPIILFVPSLTISQLNSSKSVVNIHTTVSTIGSVV